MSSTLPTRQPFALYQNVPKPFDPATRIAFDRTQPGNIDLSIYDVVGRKIATLLNERRSSGPHFVDWNCRSDAGQAVAAGV